MPALIRPPNHPLWRWNMRKYTTIAVARKLQELIISSSSPRSSQQVKASDARRCGMRNYFIIAHFSPPRRRRGKKRRKQNLRARIDTCTAQHTHAHQLQQLRRNRTVRSSLARLQEITIKRYVARHTSRRETDSCTHTRTRCSEMRNKSFRRHKSIPQTRTTHLRPADSYFAVSAVRLHATHPGDITWSTGFYAWLRRVKY